MDQQRWRCARCSTWKQAHEFGRNSDPLTKIGRPVMYICRDCVRIYQHLRHEHLKQGTWAGAAIRKRGQPAPYAVLPFKGVSFWEDGT